MFFITNRDQSWPILVLLVLLLKVRTRLRTLCSQKRKGILTERDRNHSRPIKRNLETKRTRLASNNCHMHSSKSFKQKVINTSSFCDLY